jgi:hypothetical protein
MIHKTRLWALATVAVVLATSAMSIGPASAAALPNDAFASAETLAASGSIVRSNVGATAQANEPAPMTGTAYATVWFKWTAPATGRTTFDTIGSVDSTGAGFDTVFSVYTGATLTTLVEQASDDDGFDCNTQSWLQFDAVKGRVYRIQIGSWDPSLTTATLHLNWNGGAWGPAPANDDFAHADALFASASVVNGTTFASTWEDAITSDYGLHSVWYSYTATAPTTLNLSLIDSAVANGFGMPPAATADVYSGPPDNLTLLGAASSGSPTTGIDLLAGDKVSVSVSSGICPEGGFSLAVNPAPARTSVTTGYAAGEVSFLNGVLASKFGGISLAQFQHDAVGAWTYIYGVAGITTPTPIAAPAGGPVSVTTVWSDADYVNLTKLDAQWATNDSDTQKIATLVLAFLVATYG